jgi:hypothetical protein
MRLTQAALCMLAASLAGCQDVENVLNSGTARIQVQNLRGSTLMAVYTPLCTGGDLGANKLELAGGTVPHGGLASFYIDAGCYDVIGDWGGGIRQTVQDVRAYNGVQSRVVFPN